MVEKVVAGVHRRRIFPFYSAESYYRPRVSLIVGVRCANKDLALLKTSESDRNRCVPGASRESVGNGRQVFEYWATVIVLIENLMSQAAAYFAPVHGAGSKDNVWVTEETIRSLVSRATLTLGGGQNGMR